MFRNTSAILILACLALASAQAAENQSFRFAAQGGPCIVQSFRLLTFSSRLASLDKDRKTAVTRSQASKLLALLRPLRAKQTLTSAQAKSALDAIDKVLTKAQLAALSANVKQTVTTVKPGDKTPGPPSSGSHKVYMSATGSGSPGSAFNPYYSKPVVDGLPNKDMVKQVDAFFSFLEKRAKGQ